MPSNRAFTLIEVLMVVCIFALVLTVTAAVMQMGKATKVQAGTVLALTGDVSACSRQLRRDLEGTDLSSVRAYDAPPSCSMATATGPQGDLKLSPFATPAWQGHILYYLEATEAGRARLIRWRRSQPGQLPVPSPVLPWKLSGSERRVVLTNLLAPGWDVQAEGNSYALKQSGSAKGGFAVHLCAPIIWVNVSCPWRNPPVPAIAKAPTGPRAIRPWCKSTLRSSRRVAN